MFKVQSPLDKRSLGGNQHNTFIYDSYFIFIHYIHRFTAP